jgi:hypothetical protein
MSSLRASGARRIYAAYPAGLRIVCGARGGTAHKSRHAGFPALFMQVSLPYYRRHGDCDTQCAAEMRGTKFNCPKEHEKRKATGKRWKALFGYKDTISFRNGLQLKGI